jgi:hypothetical protein
VQNLLAAVGVWLCLFSIPLCCLIHKRTSVSDVLATVRRFVALGTVFVVFAAGIGGGMSGATGAVGSSVAALLWFAWFAMSYTAYKVK